MINQDEMTPYTAPLQDLFHPPAPLPVGAAIRLADARRRRFEADPHARLEAIRQACRDLKAGVVGDPLLQAECLRPWPAFYRAVVEIEGVDKLEMFGTALVRMTRALLDEELARERANASPRVQQGKPPANHNPI